MSIEPIVDKNPLEAEFMAIVSNIASLNIEEFVRKDLGSAFNFENVRPVFEKIVRLFGLLKIADLSLASEAKLVELRQQAREIQNQLQEIRSFQPGNQNLSQFRDTKSQLIRQLFDKCFDSFSGLIAYSTGWQIDRHEMAARVIVEKLDTTTREAMAKNEALQRNALKELEGTVKAAKEAAEIVGIVAHAKFFEEEALSHKRSAYVWLVVTIILAGLAGAAAWLNFDRMSRIVAAAAAGNANSANTTKPEGLLGLEVQLTVAKLIILSILLSASIWAGRVYKSHRHNFVINRHRRNALSTFETFARATDDVQTKNAVLLQATNCIFGPQNTGYISQDKESETYPHILEIIRGNPAKKD
jgi:hypothetical protein